MNKLVILTPPYPLTEFQQDQARRELAEWSKRGADTRALVLDPGWTREVVEGDQVFVRLALLRVDQGQPVLGEPVEGLSALHEGRPETVEDIARDRGPHSGLTAFRKSPGGRRDPGFGADG